MYHVVDIHPYTCVQMPDNYYYKRFKYTFAYLIHIYLCEIENICDQGCLVYVQ